MTFNSYLNTPEINSKEMKNIEKYCKIFSTNNLPNLLKITETVMVIPIGNDFVERVFSHLSDIWTDKRNRLSLNMVKAEVCISNNYDMNCIDFISFAKNNQNLINSVKSSQKYNYSKK
jgi:hypothetical protein